MCCFNAFDGLHLHILRMFGIMRVRFPQFRQMFYLVIKRYRLASIRPHLRTHLEHIVLQLLLMSKLRIKPLLLQTRRICSVFEGLFHCLSHFTLLTPFQWVGRHVTLRLRWKCLPVWFNEYNIFGMYCPKKEADFPPPSKGRGFQSVNFEEVLTLLCCYQIGISPDKKNVYKLP